MEDNMAQTFTSTPAELGGLFDDDSELTDISDSEETPPPTSEELLHTQLPDSMSSQQSSMFPLGRIVTYKSKRKIPKRIHLQSSPQKPSTKTEIRGRVTKRVQPESAFSMSPDHVKRRKVEETLSSSLEAGFFASSTPATLPSQRSSSSEFDDTFGDRDIVWVKVNLQGEIVQSNGENDWFYWWPAQVLEDDPTETIVELFGKPKHVAQTHVKLRSASSTILSFRRNGQIRFDESCFHKTSQEDSRIVAVLPEFIRKWKIALTQAFQAEKEVTLPDATSLIYEATPSKIKTAIQHENEFSSPQTSFEPSSPMDGLKFNEEDGELVLASDRRNCLDHWPAKVVGRSFDKRTKKWLYEILYMDGGRQKVDRSKFFTLMEPGFGTCQMGLWETVKSRSKSDTDDEDDKIDFEQGVDGLSCFSFSNPDLPDFEDTDEFFDRSLSFQMRYVYPILCRAIRLEYPPSVKLHEAFMKGGKSRQQLVQSGAEYGQFSEHEVKKIANLLRKTMLGNEQWGERIVEDDTDNQQVKEGDGDTATEAIGDKGKSEDSSTTKMPSREGRPRGCEEYESLSRADRGLYSTDVLLRIAILQLHLLRSGERRSWKMESEEHENTLYARGLELMAVKPEHHWVNVILAMRQIAENPHNDKKTSRRHPQSALPGTKGDEAAQTRHTQMVETTPADTPCVPMTRSRSNLRQKPDAKR